MSIRRTLVAAFAVLLTLIGALAAIVSYVSARNEAWDNLDLQQRQIARFLGNGENIGVPDTTLPSHDGDEDFFIEIAFRDGRPLRRSSDALVLPAATPQGFSDFSDASGTWRLYTEERSDRFVRVAQRTAERDEIATDSAVRSAVPLLLAIPLLWIVTYLLVGLAMRRLLAVADAIEGRAAADITPIAEADVPIEIRPLVAAMNRAFGRLRDAIDQQQAFLSDAAHELRTPLAAISVQVDLLRDVNRDAELTPMIGALAKASRRASVIISQLLRLARQEAGRSVPELSEVALEDIVVEAVAALIPVAEAQGVDIGLASIAVAPVIGNPQDLAALMEVVLDNAVRYTPAGGTVDVAITGDAAVSIVTVADTGPGIAAEALPRVFERFFRAAGEESGTGLGLAIARAIADRHGASIMLANRPDRSGLIVSIRFPKRLIRA